VVAEQAQWIILQGLMFTTGDSEELGLNSVNNRKQKVGNYAN
jgi:hypothetical protein